MNDGFDRLAKKIKENKNKKKIGARAGVIKSTSPFIVSIDDEFILVEGKELILCEAVVNLEVGDKVLCVPEEDQQHFYAAGKIRG